MWRESKNERVVKEMEKEVREQMGGKVKSKGGRSAEESRELKACGGYAVLCRKVSNGRRVKAS